MTAPHCDRRSKIYSPEQFREVADSEIPSTGWWWDTTLKPRSLPLCFPPTQLPEWEQWGLVPARLIFSGPVSGKPDWPQRKDLQVDVSESSKKSGFLWTTVRWRPQEVSSVVAWGGSSQLCSASLPYELWARHAQPDVWGKLLAWKTDWNQ